MHTRPPLPQIQGKVDALPKPFEEAGATKAIGASKVDKKHHAVAAALGALSIGV